MISFGFSIDNFINIKEPDYDAHCLLRVNKDETSIKTNSFHQNVCLYAFTAGNKIGNILSNRFEPLFEPFQVSRLSAGRSEIHFDGHDIGKLEIFSFATQRMRLSSASFRNSFQLVAFRIPQQIPCKNNKDEYYILCKL